MARNVKDHESRHSELLDIAQELFLRQGYDTTTVNDIISEAGIAKGTFYHYFESKLDLLDQLVMRRVEAFLPGIREIVSSKRLNALEKLNSTFELIHDWKVAHLDLMLVLTRLLYREENLMFRHRLLQRNLEMLAPEYRSILHQGMEEGIFRISSPDDTAELLMMLFECMNRNAALAYLEMEDDPRLREVLLNKLGSYQEAIERILGVPEGSLDLLDDEIVDTIVK